MFLEIGMHLFNEAFPCNHDPTSNRTHLYIFVYMYVYM